MWGESKYTIRDKLDNAVKHLNDICLDQLTDCNNVVNLIDLECFDHQLNNCNEKYLVNKSEKFNNSVMLNNFKAVIIGNFNTIKMYVDCYCDPFRSFESF